MQSRFRIDIKLIKYRNEKIWKLEYWEPTSHQEPDEQDKIKDDEIQDEST